MAKDEQLSFYTEQDVADAHTAGFWSGVFAVFACVALLVAGVWLTGIVSIQPLP